MWETLYLRWQVKEDKCKGLHVRSGQMCRYSLGTDSLSTEQKDWGDRRGSQLNAAMSSRNLAGILSVRNRTKFWLCSGLLLPSETTHPDLDTALTYAGRGENIQEQQEY